MIRINNIHFINTGVELGEGGFGQVELYEGTNRKKIAVKSQLNDPVGYSYVEDEYQIHNALSLLPGSRNVIKMLGRQIETTHTLFALEFAAKGSLFDRCLAKEGTHPRMIRHFFKMMIDGVKFIHKNGIVHRDIKPENLLLTASGILKIADFGKACQFIQNGTVCYVDNTIGTLSYAAPELIHEEEVLATPIDVFACGVSLLHIACSSASTWTSVNDKKYARWENKKSKKGDKWVDLDSEILDFLHKIIKSDVATRATIKDIEKDKWYTKGDRSLRSNSQKKTVFENEENDLKAKKRNLAPSVTTSNNKKQKHN